MGWMGWHHPIPSITYAAETVSDSKHSSICCLPLNMNELLWTKRDKWSFTRQQALYVPSFIKKPCEKYSIKATGTEKALGVLPLVIVTYTQCKQDSIKQVKQNKRKV